ncbi:MAG: YceI family protein [Acidimicrobiia bacterium]
MSNLSDLTPGTWTVDASHSTVGFVARHLMITKVRGRFTEFSGSIEIPANPLDATLEATVNLASVDTGDAGRDEHLRGADFFKVEESSEMHFKSTGVKEKGGEYALLGDLTIAGLTHPVEFELEFDGVSTDPWGNTKAGFTATTEISRKQWGLEWNVALDTKRVLVGDKIKVEPSTSRP